MKELIIIFSTLLLSLSIQAQSGAERLFKKHYSEYINNYSSESDNIPTDSTIEEFREQYKKLNSGLIDIENFTSNKNNNLSIFFYDELEELKKNSQIDFLHKLLTDTIDTYKRFLGENSQYGIGKDYFFETFLKYKNRNTGHSFDAALRSWRQLYIYFPRANSSIYSSGDVIFRKKIKETEGEIREKYIDTLLMIYDKRIKYFGEAEKYGADYSKGKKGMYLYEYRVDSSLEEAYTLLKESVEAQKEDTRFTCIKSFYEAGIDMYKYNKIKTEELFNNYYKCVKYLTLNTS